MTKEAKFVIGAIVALILAVLGAMFLIDRDDAGTDGNSGGRSGDNIFVSDEFRFSFEIPDGYELVEVSDPNQDRHSIVLSRTEDSVVPQNGEGPTAITIDIFSNVEEGSAEEWVRGNNISNFGLAMGDLEDEEVAGESAVAYRWDGLYLGRSIVFMHRENIIMASGTYLESSDRIFSDFDRVVDSIELE